MKRKASIQKQAMIEALKPRYYVLEWDGGYNLYDTTKPARQTNCGDFVAQIYLNNDYSKYVYNKKRYDPDYWTRLEHQYAGMAMQGLLTNINLTKLLRDEKVSVRDKTHLLSEWAKMYAHALVQKLKEKEERK